MLGLRSPELAHQLCNAPVLPGHAWAWRGAVPVPCGSRVGAEKWGLASQQCLGLALWGKNWVAVHPPSLEQRSVCAWTLCPRGEGL